MILDYKRFGLIIRKMRQEQGLSQKELASGICDHGTLSKIENGKVPSPQKDHVFALIKKLGEADFYERYDKGLGLEQFRRKEYLKDKLLTLIKYGRVDNVEELLMELRTYIVDEGGEDMQYYLSMQTMWYRMNGVNNIQDWSNRYIEIFEMSKKFPEPDMSIEDFKRLRCNVIEKQIINFVGISKLLEGEPQEACKIFMGLFIIMTQDENSELPEEQKKLAKLCNNIALAAAKSNSLHAASKFVEYADKYTSRSKDLTLITMTERVKAEVAESCGRYDEASSTRKRVEDFEKILEKFGTDLEWLQEQTKLHNGIAIL